MEDKKPEIFVKILNLNITDREFKNSQEAISEISNSLGNPEILDVKAFSLIHQINSIIFLYEDGKPVAYIYASPIRDYAIANDSSLDAWHINFIQTHKNYQNKGYAKMLIVECLKDICAKGGKTVSGTPNEKVQNIIKQIIGYYGFDVTYNLGTFTITDLDKINLDSKQVL